MPADLNFLDIVMLEKIQGEAIMDSFSGMIGTSFFETAEVMGKMKVKGIVDIIPTIGKSIVKRTPTGEMVLKQADAKVTEPLDELDYALMKTIASGVNEFGRIQEQINIRSEDIAYRIYKITKQGYVDYTIRNARTYLTLTESGFKLTGIVPKAPSLQGAQTIQTTLTQPPPQLSTQVRQAPVTPVTPESVFAGERARSIEFIMSPEDATKHLPPAKEP
ncbi:MAG: hypothetical protein QW112_03875, partial [Candidatus Micrarchaeia archaeon]